MDPEIKKAIEENRRLIEENNKLIKKIRRGMLISKVITVLYWVVIIGATVGTYYFIQPYIDIVTDGYNNVRSGFEAAQSVSDSITEFGDVNSILSNFGELTQ